MRPAVRRIAVLCPARGFAALLGVSLVVSLLIGFRPSIDPLGPGVDRSHFYALQHATVRGWRWGMDFVSTHGPYSYLLETMDVGDLASRRAVFELALAIASGTVIALTARSVPGLRTAERLALALLLGYALHVQVVEYRWFGLFWLCLLLGLHGSRWAGLLAYGAAGFLGGFYTLIKLSLGGGALLTVAAGCVTRTPSVAVARFIVAFGAWTAGLLTAWIGQFGDLAGLRSHLTLGWEVAAGYPSGMSLARPGWWASAAAFVVFLALLAWWAKLQGGGRARLTLAAAAVPLFVVWKHGLVRSGAGHVHLLLTFPLLVVAVLLGDSWSTSRRARTLPILGVAVCVLLLPWVLQPSRVHPRETLSQRLLRPLTGESITALARLVDWDHYRATVAAQSAQRLRGRLLSDPERALIGNAPVDVYPFEISYVPANGLTWKNRPLAASYASYTPRLDDLNAAFFASERRPAFLLWHTLPAEQRDYRGAGGVLTIDGRHVLWDEPHTIRTILSAYDLRMVGSSALILARRATVRRTSAERLDTVTVDWKTWTNAPAADGVLVADVSVPRSWLARAVRIVLREDPMYVALRFASGEVREYRFSSDVAAHGLWISPFPTTAEELRSVLRGGPAQRVTAIRFRGGLASGSNPPLQVAWWRLDFAPPLQVD